MGTQGAGTIQNFNFTLTTSLGYVSVASKGCSDCSDTPLYDISLSPEAKSLSGQPAMSLGAGNFSGSLMKENCTLPTTSGAPWSYTNQTVVLMNNTSPGSPFQDGISGLLGLGTLKQPTTAAGFSASFDDGLYGQYYIRNPEAANFTFGMMLNPSPVIPGNSTDKLSIAPGAPSLADQDAGTIHWQQPDPSAYKASQVSWTTAQGGVTSGYIAGNQQPDLTVQLDGWSAKIGSNGLSSASFMANIDPYYSGIYLPGSEARLIYDAISGSQLVQKSTIPGQTVSWEVPCNTAIQFTVSIGSQQFSVDQSLLVQKQSDGTCISIIEGFADDSVTQYIFGQTWISQLYVIFNIPKDGSASIAFAPRAASSKSRDIGAIVGGTVGGVAGVVALGLLAFYIIRRRQDNTFFRRAAELEEEHKVASTVEPYTFGGDSGASALGHHPSLSASAYGSPPVSPHAGVPLLDRDAGPLPQLPPSYEEASEAGGSSSVVSPGPRAGGFPSEKGVYRRDTVMTTATTTSGFGSAPTTPNQQPTFGDSKSAV
ncbi:acid protease [Dichomitus squalens LYAD-421 SS1]|uniref:Acid protease n=1 Tax=Dichomitus squalens (strain LYAD-421) TaxID=732165 RepID=R7SS86_DICSQ|nr:acid protease [Dichomitus squalens LYAD-421 SS1]EJF58803.1 acid protease [Dichomitus squalens LYAD-421 SS1]